VGFGALIGSVALIPVFGAGSLLLAPVGVLALRGCPTCWAIGLMQTISMGRLRRSCMDGQCELTAVGRARRPRGDDNRDERDVQRAGEGPPPARVPFSQRQAPTPYV
jgi:hypothetical protein